MNGFFLNKSAPNLNFTNIPLDILNSINDCGFSSHFFILSHRLYSQTNKICRIYVLYYRLIPCSQMIYSHCWKQTSYAENSPECNAKQQLGTHKVAEDFIFPSGQFIGWIMARWYSSVLVKRIYDTYIAKVNRYSHRRDADSLGHSANCRFGELRVSWYLIHEYW